MTTITVSRQRERQSRVTIGRAWFVRTVRRPFRWWAALTPPERVLYRAIGLLAIGCALVWPPAAFLVPGLVFALVFFGFSFRRSG